MLIFSCSSIFLPKKQAPLALRHRLRPFADSIGVTKSGSCPRSSHGRGQAGTTCLFCLGRASFAVDRIPKLHEVGHLPVPSRAHTGHLNTILPPGPGPPNGRPAARVRPRCKRQRPLSGCFFWRWGGGLANPRRQGRMKKVYPLGVLAFVSPPGPFKELSNEIVSKNRSSWQLFKAHSQRAMTADIYHVKRRH